MTWDHETASATVTAAVAVGLVGGRPAVAIGLRQLDTGATPFDNRFLGPVAGAAGGMLGVAAAYKTGSPCYLPGLLIWAYGLSALGTCDALVKRIPTPLCRQATAATLLLLMAAALGLRDWRELGVATLSALVAGGLLTFCVRVLGAGKGDRRLSVLGGLGLGHITWVGLLVGLSAFALILSVQVAITARAERHRSTDQPLGLALALGFLLAAAS